MDCWRCALFLGDQAAVLKNALQAAPVRFIHGYKGQANHVVNQAHHGERRFDGNGIDLRKQRAHQGKERLLRVSCLVKAAVLAGEGDEPGLQGQDVAAHADRARSAQRHQARSGRRCRSKAAVRRVSAG